MKQVPGQTLLLVADRVAEASSLCVRHAVHQLTLLRRWHSPGSWIVSDH